MDQLENQNIRFLVIELDCVLKQPPIRLSFPKQQLGLCIELDEQVPDYYLNVGA